MKNQKEKLRNQSHSPLQQIIKYLGINLPKETKELYTENYKTLTSLVAQTVKASGYNVGDLGSTPGLGRSPGEGKGHPLQYSGLENSVDFIVHGVTTSWTRLSDFTLTFHFHALEKEMATHSSTLAWKIPWTVEPGRLQSMG